MGGFWSGRDCVKNLRDVIVAAWMIYKSLRFELGREEGLVFECVRGEDSLR